MVCDYKKDDCADCAPRKKIDTFAPAHADRRSTAPARFQDEPSVPSKAAVPKAAAKKGTEGEHPVSAKCWGLRNRFVRWWVPGFTPDNPIFASLFEKKVIFLGANRVSAAFQPVSANGLYFVVLAQVACYLRVSWS